MDPLLILNANYIHFLGNLNRHKKVKHGISEPVETSEEEAAKILNEMSGNKRTSEPIEVYPGAEYPSEPIPGETYPGENYSGDGFPLDAVSSGEVPEGAEDPGSSPSVTPSKKKRKSTPRKTIPTIKTPDNGEEGFNGTGGVAWPEEQIMSGGTRTVIAAGMKVTIQQGDIGMKSRGELSGVEEEGEEEEEDMETETEPQQEVGRLTNMDNISNTPHSAIVTSHQVLDPNGVGQNTPGDQLSQEHSTLLKQGVSHVQFENMVGDHVKENLPTDDDSSESVDVQRKNLASLIAKKFKPPLKT